MNKEEDYDEIVPFSVGSVLEKLAEIYNDEFCLHTFKGEKSLTQLTLNPNFIEYVNTTLDEVFKELN